MILDLYSRYVVGWLIAEAESAALAEQLLADKAYSHPSTRRERADAEGSAADRPSAIMVAS